MVKKEEKETDKISQETKTFWEFLSRDIEQVTLSDIVVHIHLKFSRHKGSGVLNGCRIFDRFEMR